jgi:large repetitive protein
MIRAALAAAFVLALPHPSAAQVRDRAPAPTGTASITGRVMADTEPARPLRRAVVTLNSADRTTARTAVADDQGRFTIPNLPAGRYLVTASKRGWVTMSYGARASGRPGRSIALADGERVTANLQLPRGAVITGVVLDQSGQPLQGAFLRVLRYAYAFNTGERRLVIIGTSSWGPDDRGAYRIYGLAPGEYYVAVVSTVPGGLLSQGRGLHLTSDVDVQEAQRAVQGGPGTPVADVPQRAVSVAPVFYPGTGVVAQATPVTVRAGEERSGIDFTVQYVGSGRVSGTVQGPDGPASTGARVYLVANNPSMPDVGIGGLRSSNVDSQGSFDFTDVTPGQYVLAAHASVPGTGPTAAAERILHAVAEIDAQGNDIRGLTLQLEDGFNVSGIVQFDGSATPPLFSALRVSLMPVQAVNPVSIATGGMNVGADGRFTLAGVTAGRYRLTVTTPAPWLMRSSMVGGQDSLDLSVDIRQSIADAVITLTDRASELSGRIENATGAATDYSILLFPENRAMWVAPARRILTIKTASDGTFAFRNVPPGDYQLAAVDDVEPGEWYDPAFLQRLLPGSMKVTIAEGEKKVQNIRVGGG